MRYCQQTGRPSATGQELGKHRQTASPSSANCGCKAFFCIEFEWFQTQGQPRYEVCDILCSLIMALCCIRLAGCPKDQALALFWHNIAPRIFQIALAECWVLHQVEADIWHKALREEENDMWNDVERAIQTCLDMLLECAAWRWLWKPKTILTHASFKLELLDH